MPGNVNLDALIRREDFAVVAQEAPSSLIQTIQIRDLEPDAFFYGAIRKPDFQRETNEWSPETISDFVTSFLDGDLIPAIILWKSGGNLFVIDGSHRLSALIAWVQDDFGDGQSSRQFYEHQIPSEQQKIADSTRKLLKKDCGSYIEHKAAVQNPAGARPEVLKRAGNLASLALQVQWVTGNAERAEASFFKINQQAAPIDKTELRLLESRKKPNAVAARAIVRSGTGHKYWSGFNKPIQDEIESIATDIHNTLFRPELHTPIKTLDLPVAGKGYSAQSLPLIFDFVNLANSVSDKTTLPDDLTGEKTVEFLKRCRQLVRRISGLHASSLGMHPVVYFYGTTGRYQPTAFLATIELIKSMENAKDGAGFTLFTSIRPQFEEFLLRHKHFISQITYKYGTRLKTSKVDGWRGGVSRLNYLWIFVINKLLAKVPENEIISQMQQDPKLSFLQPREANTPERAQSSDFSTDSKSATFMKEAVTSLLRCKICNGAIHVNSISIDHIVPKREGGPGIADNGQLTHPYCNTTIKQ